MDPETRNAPTGEGPRRGLPPEAYEEIPGDEYPSYVPDAERPAELTLKAIVIGVLLGIVFGAANAYLGLRVGLTVSASIPAAVMAIVPPRTTSANSFVAAVERPVRVMSTFRSRYEE